MEDTESDRFVLGHISAIDKALTEWRPLLQTPEQAAPAEAVRKAEEWMTTPCRGIAPTPVIVSTQENVAEADRELDQSFEYAPETPRGDKNSTALLVWKVQVGDKISRPGEVNERTSMYLAAATKAEAFAMATRIVRHPETPYPASLVPHSVRELVDKDAELTQDDISPEVVEDDEDPQDPGPM